MSTEVNNVVVIVIDALRTDRVGAYNCDSNLTPNIDNLAEEGEKFTECYSTINATDSSLTTILTGYYPTRHGILNQGDNITEIEQKTVAETTPLPKLLQNTHSTIGIDTLGRWHSRGFDKYENPRSTDSSKAFQIASNLISGLPPTLSSYIRNIYSRFTSDVSGVIKAEEINESAISALRSTGDPFFLFTHYWDTHIPYIEPSDHPDFISEREYEEESLEDALSHIDESPWYHRLQNKLLANSSTVGDVRRKYDAGVWKADQAVGELIEELEREGILDDTAIILTADHGESLTEHGIMFDHHGLYDPTIHVPLIIKSPGFSGENNSFVQHFDIVPTVLDILNKEYKNKSFDGVSLRNDTKISSRDAIFAEEGHTARRRCIRTDSYKFIQRIGDSEVCRYCSIKHAPDNEVFKLKEDPLEENNLAEERPDIQEKLAKELNEWLENRPESQIGEETYGVDDQTKEHLEDLGYF